MSRNGQRREPWRSSERHYCAVCNAWMGSDRQSIMLHENGKKHIENQEKAMQQKRKVKESQAKEQQTLLESLRQMEQAALAKNIREDRLVGAVPTIFPPTTVSSAPHPPPVASHGAPPFPPPFPTQSSNNNESQKEQWRERKRQREDKTSDSNKAGDLVESQIKRPKIGPDEGNYEYGGKTYLEGSIFGKILEEEMPVQIWTGSQFAGEQEKRLPERDIYWKNALVVAIRGEKVHLAYLASSTDADETVEKNVPLDRVRILLGGQELIPDTLEEALVMANGGEEVEIVHPSQSQEVDESTGLTSWSTVTIKRTTVRQEIKEERARQREQRKQAAKEQEEREKEKDARKLEELKVANADDSALGSVYFAELGREVKGYKGVDISATGDDKLTVADTVGRSISNGNASVGFKKTKKKVRKNFSRRTTSADDD